MTIQAGKPRPFTVAFPREQVRAAIEQAKGFDFSRFERNALADSTKESEDDVSLGFPPSVAKRLVERLGNGYSWEQHEKEINAMGTHHMISISGVDGEPGPLDVHVVEVRSSRKDAIAIVINHGWPGSFYEFVHLAPLLANPKAPEEQAFHCIIPSMPGYTFSSPPRHRGWNAYKAAAVIDAVTVALGYDRYVAQGGDWGWTTSGRLASEHSEHCRALHLNLTQPYGTYTKAEEEAFSDVDKEGLRTTEDFLTRGNAYYLLNSTAPYTVGLMMTTSILSTLFHIGEKLYRLSDVNSRLPDDEILTTTMLYYLSGSLTSSLWLYVAPTHTDHLADHPINIPSAWTGGKTDIFWAPRSKVEKQHKKLLVWKRIDEGGHFLAAEKPETLAREIRAFVALPAVRESLEV